MSDLVEQLARVVGPDNVVTGEEIHDDYTHDEALTSTPTLPLVLVRPGCTSEVAAVLAVADENRTAVGRHRLHRNDFRLTDELLHQKIQELGCTTT